VRARPAIPQSEIGPKNRLAFLSTNRRKFIGLAAAAGVAAIAGDSFLIEPNHPRVVRLEIELRRWPAQLEGFTIVVLSDFHYDPHFSAHPLKAAVGMVNALRPDLIVLTGDFVTVPSFGGDEQKAAGDAEPCAVLLEQMRATHGLWAVLGNHDCDTDANRVTNALLSQGIPVLDNRSVPIEFKGARFWLSGVSDILSRTSDLDATLAEVPRDEATVLLAHEPDFADYAARYPIDLQLSGHSHGGQVRIPFLPPLYLPHMARKYYMGLYKIGPLTLYTNPGLGTIGLPIRLNCPPEITLLTLRRSAG
jgi:predicted MPP superfamily phosphohydrolase